MNTAELLKKVRHDYNLIAEEFDVTRKTPWEEFGFFLDALTKIQKTTLRLLDVGCGNGRLAHYLQDEEIDYVGVDNSASLLKLARAHAPKNRAIQSRFKKAEMTSLPFPAHSFDVVASVAALHHLPTATLQLRALKHMKKVLRPGGFIFLTVWNLRQPKYKKYIDARTHHSFIPWGSPAKVERFYYAFTLSELRSLFTRGGFSSIQKVPSHHNFAYILQ